MVQAVAAGGNPVAGAAPAFSTLQFSQNKPGDRIGCDVPCPPIVQVGEHLPRRFDPELPEIILIDREP